MKHNPSKLSSHSRFPPPKILSAIETKYKLLGKIDLIDYDYNYDYGYGYGCDSHTNSDLC